MIKLDISKEEAIKEHLARNPVATTMKFTKIFNLMDRRCKDMAMSNPSRPMTDYCQRCQEMFKKILGGK